MNLLRLRAWRGLNTDIPASELPDEFYSNVFNVRFPNGVAERLEGYNADLGIGDPPVDPLRLIWSGSPLWVFVGENSQYAFGQAGYFDISFPGLSAQASAELHSLTTLNGVVVHSNAKDEPMYWPGSTGTPFAILPDWPVSEVCANITGHRYHLFASNFLSNPRLIRWSSATEPGSVPSSWTPRADNDAGFVELAESPGEIVAALTLRDTLIVYKSDSIHAADYVGGNQVYAFRPLMRAIGALSPRSIAVTPVGHVVVTQNDVFLTDGNSVTSIINNRVRKQLFDLLSEENRLDLVCYYNPIRRETYIGFPRPGYRYADRVACWCHDTQAWTFYSGDALSDVGLGIISQSYVAPWIEYPDPWVQHPEPWADNITTFERLQLVGCRPTGLSGPRQIRIMDTGNDIVRTAFVERDDLAFGEPERFKYVRRVHVRRAPASAELQLKIGYRNRLDDPITWSPVLSVEAGQSFVNTRITGRYISIWVGTTGSELWTLSGIDMEYEMRGYH